jgi:hypothetical protein
VFGLFFFRMGIYCIVVYIQQHDKFSLGRLKPNTFYVIADDKGDKSSNIPEDITDAMFGQDRTKKRNIIVNPKNIRSYDVLQRQIGGLMCRNKPPIEIMDREDMTGIEKFKACVVGVDGGNERRGVPAPPQVVPLSDGTANPVDEYGNYAYDPKMVEMEDSRELPFIMVRFCLFICVKCLIDEWACVQMIFWFIVTVCDSGIRDEYYGMAGGPENATFRALVEKYISMAKKSISEYVQNIIEPCGINDTIKYMVEGKEHSVVVCHGIRKQSLTATLTAKLGSAVSKRALPDEYNTTLKRQYHCLYCGIVFNVCARKELRGKHVECIQKAVSKPSHFVQRQVLGKTCLKKKDARCVDSLVDGHVYIGWQYKPTTP